jgi:hypothetical protein
MDRSPSDALRFARHPADAPELPSLSRVLEEARRSALGVVVVVSPRTEAAQRALAKRRHDVKAAFRTLGFSQKALETGYKFDDDKALAKIDAIAKAVQVLERESELVLAVLKPE